METRGVIFVDIKPKCESQNVLKGGRFVSFWRLLVARGCFEESGGGVNGDVGRNDGIAA
jgi:hypothetical protein